jgi:hypothetical protein
MNNNDFRAMVAGGGISQTNKGDDNNRIDLKQFSKWDKEFKRKNEKNEKKVSNKHEDGKDKNKTNTVAAAEGSKYRDRASERRNNTQGDADQELEDLVSNMPTEQTKYFGGDEKSTHLVKGLDYLLLQKMREQVGNTAAGVGTSRGTTTTSYQPVTALGASLKEMVFKKDLKQKVITPFHRATYEFHFMDSHEAPELPVLVYKSITELNIQTTCDDSNSKVRNTVSSNVLTRLKDIRSSSGFKMKRKRDELSQQQQIPPQKMADTKPMITDIYGDMFDVGPYVPQLESKPKVDSKAIIKDLFRKEDHDEAKGIKEKNYMASVQQLVQSQTRREENVEMTVDEGKVHRSIFDVADNKKSRIEQGDRFVTYSDYNIEFADVDDHD